MTSSNEELLKMTLAVSVPFKMLDIRRRGGTTARDWAWLAEQGDRFAFGSEAGASDASALLFGDGKRGTTARWAADLIRAVALLAFQPGGITLFGLHFDAGIPDAEGNFCCRTWPFNR